MKGTFLRREYLWLLRHATPDKRGIWHCNECKNQVAMRPQHMHRRVGERGPYVSEARWESNLARERGVVDGRTVSFSRMWCAQCGQLSEIDAIASANLIFVSDEEGDRTMRAGFARSRP